MTELERQDFVATHGGPALKIGPNLWVLRSGAVLTHSGWGPVGREPDPDPEKRARLQLKWAELRLEQAVNALSVLEQEVRGLCVSGTVYANLAFRWDPVALGQAPDLSQVIGDKERNAVLLEALKEIVAARQVRVRALARALEECPSVVRARAVEQALADSSLRRQSEAAIAAAARRAAPPVEPDLPPGVSEHQEPFVAELVQYAPGRLEAGRVARGQVPSAVGAVAGAPPV